MKIDEIDFIVLCVVNTEESAVLVDHVIVISSTESVVNGNKSAAVTIQYKQHHPAAAAVSVLID